MSVLGNADYGTVRRGTNRAETTRDFADDALALVALIALFLITPVSSGTNHARRRRRIHERTRTCGLIILRAMEKAGVDICRG
jgi:hypothetical protein